MDENKKKELFSFIDGDEARLAIIELETLLTAHKALGPENGGNGEMEKCEALLGWMKEKGLLSHCSVKRYDARDSRVTSGIRPNAAVIFEGSNKNAPAVWIISHLDVVPEGDLDTWRTDPWKATEKDGALYGRGVEDDQQGIVSGVLALMAFIRCNAIAHRTVKLLFVSDEEIGSEYGMKYLLKEHRLFNKDDIIIVPDGGDPKGETIEIAEKTLMWLKFTVKGMQSHASRPDLGNNACIAACDLTLRVRGLEDVFNRRDALFIPDHCTFSPTMRFANVSCFNIIPSTDVFCADIRLLPCYAREDVVAEIEKKCKETEAKYGVSIKCEVVKCASSPATQADAKVVTELKRAIFSSRGIHAKPIGISGGTVAAMLRENGYDAAVWSTVEDNAHQSNESALIDNIKADAKTFASLFG